MIRFLVLMLAALLCGCGSASYHKEEIGYKGKAKIDPYLAAGRFLQAYDYDVTDQLGWPKLDGNLGVLICPLSVVNRHSYVVQLDDWVRHGGHLVCLGEWAESYHNDWADHGFHEEETMVSSDMKNWLGNQGIEIHDHQGAPDVVGEVNFQRRKFDVAMHAECTADVNGKTIHGMVSERCGNGRVTIMLDARPFRNRYIDAVDHSALLLAIAQTSRPGSAVMIVRDASLSLWALIWTHGWPALTGLAALTVWWLWKNMPRFGPALAAEERSSLRAYEHHLEALGSFHWGLDGAAGLLRPLRESILERAHQFFSATRYDGSLFEWLGQRAGMPAVRAERAMTDDLTRDPAIFSRLVADLQTLHLSLS